MSQSSAQAGTMRLRRQRARREYRTHMSSLRLIRRAMTSRSSCVMLANEMERASPSDDMVTESCRLVGDLEVRGNGAGEAGSAMRGVERRCQGRTRRDQTLGTEDPA